ncbi:MAG: hypothetical protein AAF245_09140, partial [Pseudomonadota bacterium]
MSNSDSFLEEVTEEVRRDRMIQFLRRNALWIGLALVVIIGGAVFFEWRKSAAEAAAQARGNALWAALEMEDATARAEALAAVEMTGSYGLAFLNMQRAAALLAAEDRAGAVALLEQIAASPDSTAALRDVARLKLVSLAGDTMPEQERLDILAQLLVDGHALRGAALEQRALIRLMSGDMAAAEADLQAVLIDARTPDVAKQRVSQLLGVLGFDA